MIDEDAPKGTRGGMLVTIADRRGTGSYEVHLPSGGTGHFKHDRLAPLPTIREEDAFIDERPLNADRFNNPNVPSGASSSKDYAPLNAKEDLLALAEGDMFTYSWLRSYRPQ